MVHRELRVKLSTGPGHETFEQWFSLYRVGTRSAAGLIERILTKAHGKHSIPQQ